MTLRVLLVPGPPAEGKIENGQDRYLDSLVKGVAGRVAYTFLEDPQYARGPEKKWEPGMTPTQTRARSRLVGFLPQQLRLFLGYARDTLRLAKIFRPFRGKVDLVHVNRVGCETQTIAARLAGFRHIVSTIHNLPGDHAPNLVEKLVERLSFACGTRHIAVSKAAFEAWQRRIGLKPRKSVTIYNGMDPEPLVDFDRRAYRAQFTPDPDGIFLVGICARLHRMKGHFILLEAFKHLVEEYKVKGIKCKADDCATFHLSPSTFHSLSLLVAGEGPERANIEQRIAELGLGDSVILLGHRPDAFRVIASLDLHVLPSVALENMPYAAIEAMYAGVPQVVSDIGGAKEIIVASGGGRVVAAGDPRALADAIAFYINDADARAEAGRKTRSFAEQNLSAEQMAQKTLEVYEECGR